MHFIIDGSITDGTGYFIMQILQFELRHGVIGLNSHRRISIHPNKITQSRLIGSRCTSGHDRTGRIVSERIINDAFIHLLIILIRNFNVQVNGKMIVKKLRRYTSIKGKTFIVICLYHTILIIITYRQTVRCIFLYLTGNGKVMFLSECRTVNLILPISRNRTQSHGARNTRYRRNKLTELISGKYIQFFRNGAYRKVSRIVETQVGIGTFLSSNYNHAIRCAGTVDSSG